MKKRKSLLILMSLWFVIAGLAWVEQASAQALVQGANGYYIPNYFGTTPNWANSPALTKFVDTLPGLDTPNNLGQQMRVAVADQTTYLGSHYYVLELVEYREQMHSELPPVVGGKTDPAATGGTKLRGYRQVNHPGGVQEPYYVGPLIIAQKNVPVRVLFINSLPAGSEFFLPVDTTIMGSGPGPGALRDGRPDDQICAENPETCFSQNRATLHLHGGFSPWISDGTPHQWTAPVGEAAVAYPKGVSTANVPDMWFDAAGNTIGACAGLLSCAEPGATNNPGPGKMTFYYTNAQSARLRFYHDHAWGITRLNVYAGEAAGYLIQDPTELGLIAPGGPIPSLQIPLVIQDKTFVDATTIMTTDPTWAWGSNPAKPVTATPVTGDLWWPHVYMPAQNPYNPDQTGVNPMGRWVYGPWFWPPLPVCGTGPDAVKPFCIEYGVVPNPYNDPVVSPSPFMPGTPNPSWGAEAFMDTMVVNGTAFPTVTVPAGPVRFRLLNAGHDRFLNLQLYRAVSKVGYTNPTVAPYTFTGPDTDLTEVAMVPAAPTAGYPEFWPTDGREGGAPDPATRGPAIIQIGTEGGFLPAPVLLPNQPVNWVLDPTLFTAGLVAQQNEGGGTLFLGPAETADVIVDFTNFAGHRLILYNDAPAPWPALDPHYDYYTGAPDRTDMGGYVAIPAGVGPNIRTVMQIVVQGAVNSGTAPVDDYDAGALAALQAAFTGPAGAFASSQEPIVVGQNAYDGNYGVDFPSTWPNWGISRISDNSISFVDTNGKVISNFPMKAKAIQDEMGEVFDDYGRMSAKLGLEVPFTNAGNNNFNLQNFVDPATEIVYPGFMQIWKITHNGVDTHPVHFHLFDVQVLNRVGWDGFMYLPDPNELGWKDTVRISPLEDTIVAMRPKAPPVNFPIPNSYRPLNPAVPLGSSIGFSQIDPVTGGNLVPTRVNKVVNLGNEYVWHCHILSHEESDMMRPISFNVDSLIYAGGAAGPQTGLWQWELGSWSQLNAATPSMIAASGPLVYANLPSGLFQWNGGVQTRISANLASSMVTSGSILYAGFTGRGLYKWEGGALTRINASVPSSMVVSGTVLYASFANGLYKWDGAVWTRVNQNVPTSMVASPTLLYANFANGLYKYDGAVWTRINTTVPSSMVASGALLYASFTGQGLYKWDGLAWTRINTSIPASMVAAGQLLYASFTGQGLYKWDGTAWRRINATVPQAIVAAGSVVYADFGANGLSVYENGAWTRLTTTNPNLVASAF